MSSRYSFEFMKFVSYNMEGRMGGRSVSKLSQRNEIIMIKFEIEFKPETDQYIPWRPPIRPSMLYDTNFINSKLYLIDIKKITFISHVLASIDNVERNTKTHPFLVFRSTLSLQAKTCDINVIFFNVN